MRTLRAVVPALLRWLRQTVAEVKKMVWPSREELRHSLLIAVVLVATSSLLLFAIDAGLNRLAFTVFS